MPIRPEAPGPHTGQPWNRPENRTTGPKYALVPRPILEQLKDHSHGMLKRRVAFGSDLVESFRPSTSDRLLIAKVRTT